MRSRCNEYGGGHDFGEYTTHEERGVLVITHGRRAGRIYATEVVWVERTCKNCAAVESNRKQEAAAEWPGGL